MRPLRQHLTYANTMATVAFLLATSGSAYAAVKVNSHQIVDNSIKSVDLKNGKAVKGEDVKNGSLTGADVKNNSLTGDDIDETTLIDLPLPELPGGVSGLEQVSSGEESMAGGLIQTLTVDCPAGKVALSGGSWTDDSGLRTIWGQLSDADTYTATFLNTSLVSHKGAVNVVCVKVNP